MKKLIIFKAPKCQLRLKIDIHYHTFRLRPSLYRRFIVLINTIFFRAASRVPIVTLWCSDWVLIPMKILVNNILTNGAVRRHISFPQLSSRTFQAQ